MNITHAIVFSKPETANMPVMSETPEVAGVAEPTVASGTERTFSTAGLQEFDLGNGVMVYTNDPGALSSFTWNTGSATGSVIGTPSGIVVGGTLVTSGK